MGKSNKKAKVKNHTNPIAKPVKPPTDPELAAVREKQILPVINDLKSPEVSRRSAAAIAIANLIEDTKCRKLLLREQVVGILLEQTITDSSLESKSAGWGILRNLAVEEEADFAIHLYRQDILTPITAIIQMIIETIESKENPIAKLPKAQQSLLWTLSSSVVGLLTSLGEAQEEIVEAISNLPSILNFLFGLLNVPAVPGELFSDVLTCISTLTEDNKVLAQQIVGHESWLMGLMQLRELAGPRAVPACAVLHNIFTCLEWFDHNTPMEGASDAILIPTLVQCMSQVQGEDNLSNGSSHLNPDQILQLALEITASIATSLQEALEHGAKHEKEFEGFDDKTDGDDETMADDINDDASDAEDEDELNEEDEEEDEMTIAEIAEDMDRVIGDGSDDEDDSEDVPPTLDALIRVASPFLLKLTQTDNEAVQSGAISVLNNIAWTISNVDFSTASGRLKKSWAPLAKQIWSEVVTPVLASNTADIELASSITSLAWAVARSVQGQVQLAGDEHRKFMALYQASKDIPAPSDTEGVDPFQGLGVKCVGVLGRLALDPAPLALNREIGVFLLTVLAGLPETPAADAVEALNEIFDIYADKSYACDEVFRNDGFHKHLSGLKVKVTKAAKGVDRRKETELRSRADEAGLNLTRFLAYKLREQKN
ncbi:hypothetical protein VE03_05413 [Pseudogymnoascus sp. 23342-1-I1]|nr:hypothetical protein VE03_05413 [Pseudogymnoascus sp. 23342-1-I1]